MECKIFGKEACNVGSILPWHGEVSLQTNSRFPDGSDDLLDCLRLPEADLAEVVQVEVDWYTGVLEHCLQG